MRTILAYLRLFCILLFIPPYLIWYMLSGLFLGWGMKRALRIRRSYLRLVNYVIGLRIQVLGERPQGEGLFVCNHRSFLDPFVSIALLDSLPVSKAEVAKYPILSQGAKITGIIYVDRDKLTSRANTRMAITKWIQDKFVVLIYAEGTVNNADTTKEFKHGSFKIAAEYGFNVFPMAIEYKNRSDRWAPNTPLKNIFVTSLGNWKTDVTAHFGPVYNSDNHEELLSNTRSWIDEALLAARAKYDNS